jgi:hypothetical protein
MSQRLTPEQRRTRDRFETAIGLMAPFLNLVLSAGDRISRIVEPEDSEYYPVRSGLLEAEGQEPHERGDV